MLFTRHAAPGLADCTITLTFRTWSRPQAKVGGRYRTWGLLLEVDAVERVDIAAIDEDDARRAGYASVEVLRRKLGLHERNSTVWRVAFHCLGPDDRIARRADDSLDPQKILTLQTRLDRLDRNRAAGPWTRQTLHLIASHPGVVSTTLARRLKMERPEFKLNVRKLKELGLTESLEIGYRLSPLGEAFVRKMPR
jgi:hypothetical protein